MTTRRSLSAPLALLAALLAGGSAAADVLVVAPAAGPGVDATTIQAAVDAAVDGDTILVRPGQYPEFVIDAKALVVVADGAPVMVGMGSYAVPYPLPVRVRNLAAGQAVVVRGLTTVAGVTVTSCAGPVWFDRLVTVDPTQHYQCQGQQGAKPGASVTSSLAVTFTRCTLQAESGWSQAFSPAIGGIGLAAFGSGVQLYDCVLRGGVGASNVNLTGTSGGPGMLVSNGSTLTVSACTIQGGAGGLNFGPVCTAAHYVGGAGVLFTGSGGTLYSLESTAVGGRANLTTLCPGLYGPAGPAIDGSGTIVPLFGFARHLQSTSPVRGGETLTFTLEGRPGEVPMLLVSGEHVPLPLTSYSGVLLTGLPLLETFALGALPASGTATLAFPVPNVGALVGAVTLYAQSLFVDAPGIWLGAGATVTLLDASE